MCMLKITLVLFFCFFFIAECFKPKEGFFAIVTIGIACVSAIAFMMAADVFIKEAQARISKNDTDSKNKNHDR